MAGLAATAAAQVLRVLVVLAAFLVLPVLCLPVAVTAATGVMVSARCRLFCLLQTAVWVAPEPWLCLHCLSPRREVMAEPAEMAVPMAMAVTAELVEMVRWLRQGVEQLVVRVATAEPVARAV